MVRITLLISMLFAVSSLAGCETFRGFGKDLSNVGDALIGN